MPIMRTHVSSKPTNSRTIGTNWCNMYQKSNHLMFKRRAWCFREDVGTCTDDTGLRRYEAKMALNRAKENGKKAPKPLGSSKAMNCRTSRTKHSRFQKIATCMPYVMNEVASSCCHCHPLCLSLALSLGTEPSCCCCCLSEHLILWRICVERSSFFTKSIWLCGGTNTHGWEYCVRFAPPPFQPLRCNCLTRHLIEKRRQ